MDISTIVLIMVVMEFTFMLFIFVYYVLPPLQYIPQIYQELHQIRQALVG